MNRKAAQFRLSMLWIFSSLAIAVVLFLQTTSGILGDRGGEVWDWYSDAVLPTVTLMLGVVGGTLARKGQGTVPRGLYLAAILASVVYLGAVGLVVALTALRFDWTVFEATQRPLEFFYALATLLIGVFFVMESPSGSLGSDDSPA